MKNKNAYYIHFVGLKQDVVYVYDYNIDSSFFEKEIFDNLNIIINNLQVEVTLTKNNHLINLKISIYGSISGNCDRCTNEIEIPILDEFHLLGKMVSNPEELNINETEPDIFYIGFDESNINLQPYLLEFILLSMPNIKKCNDDGKGKFCNQEILKKIL